ncbi:hypothetical protein LTR85_005949 [Meristemomyces frigidus]|nr:hypothetical protein LTR85_005949 [Meristemomyces frigidus]
MAEPQPRPTLLTLPPELRNRIYDLAVRPDPGEGGVTGEQSICVQTAFERLYNIRHGNLTTWRTQPSITRVCRQTRDEALPIYYAANTFVAYLFDHMWDYELTSLQIRAKGIGRTNAAKAERLSIRFTEGCSDADERYAMWIGLEGYGIVMDAVAVIRE